MASSHQIFSATRKAGYKLTPQRRAIIDVVCGAGAPVTPADIHAALLPEHPDMGLVTVYRTLELLQKLGLICRFSEGTSASFKAGTAKHHHHLVCRGCGEVTDFSGHCPLELETLLEQKTGFRITDHKLEFSGICRSCREAGGE